MLEAKQYKHNYFLTLTYDEEHLPRLDMQDTVYSTLYKKDLQKFLKDLRRYYEYHYKHVGIRFYACGEYGDKTKRAHYHLIMFNMPIYTNLPNYKKNHEGIMLKEGGFLTDIWKKGYVVVAPMEWSCAAYVARYCTKKITGNRSDEYYRGRTPEFSVMSRNPGIARNFYDMHKNEIYKNDEIFITGKGNKTQKVQPSTYYDKLYDVENAEDLEDIKWKRQQVAIEKRRQELSKTDLAEKDYREIKHLKQLERAKKLPRKEI